MGGKRQGTQSTPGPRGPAVVGPQAGVNILQRVVGPMNAQAARNRDSFKDTAAPIVGTIAGIVADYFAPGTGFFASKAADRTVREQVNVINGRPFFEGVDNQFRWSDLAGVLSSGFSGAAGAGVNAATRAGGQAAGAAARAGINAANIGVGMGAGYLDRRAAAPRRGAPLRVGGYLYGR